MYAIYAYTNTATIGNIIKDITDILTGTTNKANLSAGCYQAGTSIATDYSVAGWSAYDLATNNAGSCTANNATDYITKAGHGLENNEPVAFTATALPTGISAGTTYYVINKTTDTFQISATLGGAAMDFTTDGTSVNLWTGRKQIIRTALDDDASKYIYVQLDCASTGYLNLTIYESWSATTKTGTYQSTAYANTGAAAGSQRLSVGSSGCLVRIFASLHRIVMQSAIGAGVGADTNNCWTGIFVRSRRAPWDTVGAGYLPVVQFSGFALSTLITSAFAQATRYLSPSGDVSGSTARLSAVLLGFTANVNAGAYGMMDAAAQVMRYKVPDGAGGLYCPFGDISLANATYAFPAGSISEKADVWIPPAYANLDKTTYNNKVYIFLQNTNNPQINGCLAIPMG